MQSSRPLVDEGDLSGFVVDVRQRPIHHRQGSSISTGFKVSGIVPIGGRSGLLPRSEISSEKFQALSFSLFEDDVLSSGFRSVRLVLASLTLSQALFFELKNLESDFAGTCFSSRSGFLREVNRRNERMRSPRRVWCVT